MKKRAICDIICEKYGEVLEIGLYYLQSRYYDPAVGRFINADNTETFLIQNELLKSTNKIYALTSFSGFFAFIFDLFDGKWDEYVTISIKIPIFVT